MSKKNVPHDQMSPEETPLEQGEQVAGEELEIEDPFAALEAELEGAIREREEFRERYTRALADYQNFQRRAKTNEQNAYSQATRAVLQSLLGVLDTLDLTLQQDVEQVSAEDILKGVGGVREDLARALSLHGVAVIMPEAGDVFEPGNHEAVMQQPAEGIEPGHVAMPLQAGYRIGDQVVRPAKVAVTPSEPG